MKQQPTDWPKGVIARYAEHEAREWAQDHASTCRATPRPEATG